MTTETETEKVSVQDDYREQYQDAIEEANGLLTSLSRDRTWQQGLTEAHVTKMAETAKQIRAIRLRLDADNVNASGGTFGGDTGSFGRPKSDKEGGSNT